MIEFIPPEITIASFSTIGILTGYIWNNQGKRIDKIERVQKERPCNIIHLQLAEMQTDVKWIKQKINEIK